MNAATYTMMGTTDETTVCDCCGKSNLKKTVILKHNETGAICNFGTTCASKATKIKSSSIGDYAKIVQIIQNWKNKGFSLADISQGMRRFGYGFDNRNNKLVVVFNKDLSFVLDFNEGQ